MRRWYVAVPMMLLCLLCACGSKEKDPLQAPMEFRAALLQHGGCRLRLEGTADLAERVYGFTLDCGMRTDGSVEATILQPESLAGITATLEGKTGRLSSGEVHVQFGLPGAELAPAQAPGTLIRAWTEGYLVSAGADGETVEAVFELGSGTEAIQVYTWLDSAGKPVRAELARQGRVSVQLSLSDFEWYAGGEHETAEENLGGRVPGQSGP